MRPVELVMVGAGNRGYLAYGAFAERNPQEAKFVAVVEPDDARRARVAGAHGITAGEPLAVPGRASHPRRAKVQIVETHRRQPARRAAIAKRDPGPHPPCEHARA